jgi:thiamine biosynthesis lipoprotein
LRSYRRGLRFLNCKFDHFKRVSFFHLVIGFLIFFGATSCREEKKHIIDGHAQGTTYHITYYSQDEKSLQQEIDSILHTLDMSLSTYVPASIISRVNANDSSVVLDNYFLEVFNKSIEVSKRTNGAFDITVAPLINAYGFGFTKRANVTEIMVDSLLNFVGYKMIWIDNGRIVKTNPNVMIDFNAIAQGYSVDVISEFLESKRVNNYLVELGGEVRAKGKKENGEIWKVGIDQPTEMEDGLQAAVNMQNCAMATSGNYRRYYEESGKRFAHIIDPKTGYPGKHDLLSASVVASDCMTADAYATAFMVMGTEKAKRFLAKNKDLGLEVFFIYDENGSWKTFASDAIRNSIEQFH